MQQYPVSIDSTIYNLYGNDSLTPGSQGEHTSYSWRQESYTHTESYIYIQGVPKKMSFSGKTAITTFKLIQTAKVLENSGYLLPEEKMTEKMMPKIAYPLQKLAEFTAHNMHSLCFFMTCNESKPCSTPW